MLLLSITVYKSGVGTYRDRPSQRIRNVLGQTISQGQTDHYKFQLGNGHTDGQSDIWTSRAASSQLKKNEKM